MVTGFFSFYSWSWLQSIDRPAFAVAGYEYHADLAFYSIWFFFLALLVTGNLIFWRTQKAWALWSSLGFFAVFVFIHYFFLAESLFHFKKNAGFVDSGFSVGPFIGAATIAVIGILVFLNHLGIARLHQRIHQAKPLAEEETGDHPE
jgi:hypothetical protein